MGLISTLYYAVWVNVETFLRLCIKLINLNILNSSTRQVFVNLHCNNNLDVTLKHYDILHRCMLITTSYCFTHPHILILQVVTMGRIFANVSDTLH